MSTTVNCGGLHIRTPQTDSILSPNIITQSIVSNGMRLGIIPETSILGEFSYNIVVKNSANNIIFQNSQPIIYTGYGNYLYIIIPFSSLPNVGEIINIKLSSTDGCATNTNYSVLSYTSSTDSTTTVNVNGSIDKYLKLKPSINYGGYFKDNFYYFKCNKNTDTDDECFIQFKQNTDPSKVLTSLPTGTEVVSCPDSSDWVYINTLCVSNTPSTTSSTTISTTTLTPCSNGLKLDNIVFVSGTTYKIYFTSMDAQSINWRLFNNINVQIKSGSSGTLTTSNFNADFGTLTDGTYKLIIQASNCSSNIADGTKTFVKGVASSTTISGSTTTSTTTISGSGQNTFINYLKNVSGSSELGKYYPQAFPIISVKYETDNILNKTFPKWAVAWQVEGANFYSGSRVTQDVGIAFNYDMIGAYNSYGVRCLDYVKETNPNTGLPWDGDIDTSCIGSQFDDRYGGLTHTWQNFRTRIPFENKAYSGYGVTKGDNINDRWDAELTGSNIKSHQWIFDKGLESVQARAYGHGDKVGGKVNVGFINSDVENGEETGETGTNNHLAFALGMASGSLGYTFSQYSAPINVVFQQPSLYPEDNGTYLSYRKNLDGTIRYWINPSTNVREPEPNNIPSSNDWNPNNKLTISGRISNKGLIDFPTFLPCAEISSTSDMTFRQGETYLRNTDGTTRLVNKFGTSANTNHLIADVIQAGDVNKWYIENKFDGRKVVLQTKITCDRANEGIFIDAGFNNGNLKFAHYNRRYSFIMGGMTALTGCEWNVWDRNYDGHILDGYHGAFGIINLLNQSKDFNGISKSFVDLKPNFEFLLWNSEISYENDVNGNPIWIKDKAYDYVMNSTHIPQRQAITSDGYWCGFLARPENTEATSCKLRVLYSGNYYYYTVTSDMWETVNYDYRNTQLNQIPNSDKDYHYFLVKLTAGSTTSSTTSSTTISTTVNPNPTYQPVIVMVGESNAGSRVSGSNALTGELGIRNGVRILNNNTNNLETLNIPINSNFGENDRFDTGWGWELQLANLRATGQISQDIVVVKTAQGGALIGQYNTDIPNGYYSILENRINRTKTLLEAEGKTPIFYILYSQGINNASYPNIKDIEHYPNLSGIDYWKQATLDFLVNIRKITGTNTKICMTKFFGNFGTYLNTAIDQIVASNTSSNFSIPTNDLTIQADGLHFDASSTKTIANRMSLLLNYFGVGATNTTISTTTIGNGTDGFKLTQPNKSQYYFSNGKNPSYYDNILNLPAIHTSETHQGSVPSGKLLSGITMPARYNASEDFVWLENNYIKIGLNLKRGGQIAWASLSGSTTNLVYNGYDGGFQIQLDAYENPDGYKQEGQEAGKDESGNLTGSPRSFNVTNGGDYKNNSVSLIDYHPTTNGYYVKLRPLLYPMRGLLSETYIEVTYTLTTNAVKCDYKYTSFRTDAQRSGGIVGWSIPACFLVNTLNKYATYNGNSPFTNDSVLTTGNVSSVSTAGTCGSPIANTSTENWIMCYNQSSGVGLGVYNATNISDRARMEVKQCEVYLPDGAGTEFTGGFTFMSPTYSFNLPANQNFTKSATAYVIIGTIDQVRNKAYSLNQI